MSVADKKRLVFISNMAAPYQVKFCYELQKLFVAEFWFHVYIEPNRPRWWMIDLGDKCKILRHVLFKKHGRYLSFEIFSELKRFDPDIILLGGFGMLTNILAYWWGKAHGRKVLLLAETYRGSVDSPANATLRRKGFHTAFLHALYRKVDGVLATNAAAEKQMRDQFQFKKVTTVNYPADIDRYFEHPSRYGRLNFALLFGNRLVENYDPMTAIRVFAKINKMYPLTTLRMNSSGPLYGRCKDLIRDLGLEGRVDFLDQISSWDAMGKIYCDSDILVLPAKFSNGNFTVVEAMASGMGIVVSDQILELPNGFTNEQNGFICPPTVDSFVTAVSKYLSNPKLFDLQLWPNRELVRKYTLHDTAILFANRIDEVSA